MAVSISLPVFASFLEVLVEPMPSVHSIRLTRPWNLLASSAQQIRAERYFHRPSGLTDGQAVWLVIDCQVGCQVGCSVQAMRLNEVNYHLPEGSGNLFRWQIATQLETRNRIELELFTAQSALPTSAAQAGQRVNDRLDLSNWAEVRLEIDSE